MWGISTQRAMFIPIPAVPFSFARQRHVKPIYRSHRDVISVRMHSTAGIPGFGATRAAKPGEIAGLLETLSTGDATARLRALLATRELSAGDAAPVICGMLENREESMLARGFACLFLGYKPNDRSHTLLVGVVEDPEEASEVIANAVAALGYLRDPLAIPLCLRLLRAPDTHWTIRSSAAVSIGVIAEVVPRVRDIVYDDLLAVFDSAEQHDTVLLQAVIGALGDVRNVGCVSRIGRYVDADDFVMAQCACEALGHLVCEESLLLLRGVLERGAHVNVHWAAEIAVENVEQALR